ncbi:MAG: TfoX/Sxy family protein [Gammaproteobacteria bacterium]|jgi:DNA transformation protein|nr:TfoX/Sxy family protein [Gammaproteobacteria bacterium]
MDVKLTDLPNIGAHSADILAQVDITSANQLRQLGAVQAFHRVWFHANRKPSENLLWVLAGALENRHWKSFSYEEKKGMLSALDAHRRAQTLNDELQA